VPEINQPFDSEAPTGISRRTVTKAMAWAVPVIAVSAAAPAYAASQLNISFSGAGCKLPGNSNPTYKGYAFLVSITNASLVNVTITISTITLNGLPLGTASLVDLPPSATSGSLRANPFILPPGISIPAAALVTSGASNSQNGTLSITYTVDDGALITATVNVPSAPPINGGSCSTFNAAQKLVLASVLQTNVPVWTPNTVYALGDTVSVAGGFLAAIVAGTSGATEPVLPAPGGQVVDNTVTWQRPGA